MAKQKNCEYVLVLDEVHRRQLLTALEPLAPVDSRLANIMHDLQVKTPCCYAIASDATGGLLPQVYMDSVAAETDAEELRENRVLVMVVAIDLAHVESEEDDDIDSEAT